MSGLFFNPGCAMSLYKSDMEKRVLEILNRHIGPVRMHKICCRHEPLLEAGSRIINVCAGCDRRFRSLYAGVTTISLWEVLDGLEGFQLPDHAGLRLSVHDPCPVREKPQVHKAVRSLLVKMGIVIEEAEFNRTRSVCCGDDLYGKIPLEQVHAFMRERAGAMPCRDVCVYCVSCVKSMAIGGRTPRHLLDLIFGESTEAGDVDTVRWHAALDAYIETH